MSLIPPERNLSILSSPSHADQDGGLVCLREILEVEGLARADADAGEFGADVLALRVGRDELKCCVEILEEVVFDPRGCGREEIDLRRGRGRGLFEKRGERLYLISRLHLDDVRHVCRIEELSPISGERERRSRVKDFLDARGGLAFPVWTDDEIVAWLASRGAAADVAIVVDIAVAEHDRVIALLFHRRHREHYRLSAQVQPDKRVRRVTVWRDNGRVLVGKDAGFVFDLVEGRLELGVAFIHGVLVHHRVVHNDGQTVDKALLGYRFGVFEAGGCRSAASVFLFTACHKGCCEDAEQR